MRRWGKTTVINVIVTIICFLIAPISMYVYSTYIDYDSTAIMGIAFLLYIYVGPVVAFILGVLSGRKAEGITQTAITLLICCLLVFATVLNKVTPALAIVPLVTLCIGYGMGRLIHKGK